jgi:hypothetical protein
MPRNSPGPWRYYRLAVIAGALLLLAQLVAGAVIKKAEIDQLWREQEETEVPLWVQL